MHHEMMINRRKTCTEVDLLLHIGTGDYEIQNKKKRASGHECEFQCKTCGRWFSSFQALGGHRTSHKRRRNIDINGDDEKMMMIRKLKKAKTKSSHECSVCGVEFEMGQALGGHMRRHKPVHLMKKAAVGTSEMKKKKQLFFLDLNLFPWENDHLILQDHHVH